MNSIKFYYDNGAEFTVDSVNCYHYGTVYPLRKISSVSVVAGYWIHEPFATLLFISAALIGLWIFIKTFIFWYLLFLFLPVYDFLWRRTEYHLEIQTGGGWENATYVATRKGLKKYYELYKMRDALVEAMNQLDNNSNIHNAS